MGTSDAKRSTRIGSLWLVKWARSEEFWRDVTAEFFAGLGLLLVAVVGAVVAGYVEPPAFLKFLLTTAYILLTVGVVVAVFVFIMWVGEKFDLNEYFGYGDRSLPVVLGLFIVWGAVALYTGVIASWLETW